MKKRFMAYILTLSMLLSMLPAVTLAADAGVPADEPEGVTAGELAAALTTGAEQATAADALQELADSLCTGISADGSADHSAYDYRENQMVDDSAGLLENSAEISAASFDLRHVGGTVTYDQQEKKHSITGGVSYVTPVKLQNPWATCWSFGIIAAAETSILYETGDGTAAADNTQLDFSEHHLAWFAKNHIPVKGENGYGTNAVANQEGEGVWQSSGTSGSSMSGGFPFFGTSVFAAGVGIVPEYYIPYQGTSGAIMARRKTEADLSQNPDRYLYYASLDAWNAEPDTRIKENYYAFCYSDEDDWSLDESLRFAQSYALEESNILPGAAPLTDPDTGEQTVLNEEGILAVKSELTAGRGVEVCYYADTSDPNQDTSVNTSRYINSNYASFCWDRTYANHSVCIVGWDDDYSASNFGQEHPVKYNSSGKPVYRLKDSEQELTYSQDGESLYYRDEKGKKHVYSLTSDEIELAREADGSVSVPAGDGAWIVKNSWGSADSTFPNQNDWGYEGSGYFYLSYYDISISYLETYDFADTAEEQQQYDYSVVDEYDYMTAYSTSQSVTSAPVMMANIFTAETDMELEAVSCETTTPGTTVIYEVCLLDADEACPTENTTVQAHTEPVQYRYGGYHREVLEQPVALSEGQKYAVIVTEYYQYTDENGDTGTEYYICSNTGYNKEYADLAGTSLYYCGVINPGESYILEYAADSEKMNGTDYSDYVAAVRSTDENSQYIEYDNFSIKAYGKPTSEIADPNQFEDVQATEYYYTPVYWALKNNITSGTSATTFSPNETCTRAQVVTFLYRAAGKPEVSGSNPFTDVKESDYYYKAVLWGYQNKIVYGTSDTTFSPNDKVTRSQFVTFLWRYAEKPAATGTASPFRDLPADAYYTKAVLWGNENKIVYGTDPDRFSPEATCTRAQVVTFLYRYSSK